MTLTMAEKRRRERHDAMLYSNIRWARMIRAAVVRAIETGERDRESGASMLRSIDRKIERWQRETYA